MRERVMFQVHSGREIEVVRVDRYTQLSRLQFSCYDRSGKYEVKVEILTKTIN
jgi:hypothetical protein